MCQKLRTITWQPCNLRHRNAPPRAPARPPMSSIGVPSYVVHGRHAYRYLVVYVAYIPVVHRDRAPTHHRIIPYLYTTVPVPVAPVMYGTVALSPLRHKQVIHSSFASSHQQSAISTLDWTDHDAYLRIDIRGAMAASTLTPVQQRRKLIAFFIAVAFLSSQLFYSEEIFVSYRDDVIDEPQLLSTTTASNSRAVIQLGREYSARACWLDPPWGMGKSLTEACSSNSSIYNTSATQLSCFDKPLSNVVSRTPTHDMPRVTIALLYFAKPAMLMRQLENFESYPLEIRRLLTILVVDDGSPEGLQASEYISRGRLDNADLRLRLAHITTDKAWNIGGARNLAFYLADTPEVLLLDLDMLIPQETMEAALKWTTKNQTHIIAHRFNRRTPNGETRKHPAVALLDTSAYWESGGCDEDFCGSYGFTDVHFWWRWKKDKARIQWDHMDTFIMEFDGAPCNSSYIKPVEKQQKCEGTYESLQKPIKDKEPNRLKIKRKISTGCWSNRFLRFRWVLKG
jgi:hypothetical protein